MAWAIFSSLFCPSPGSSRSCSRRQRRLKVVEIVDVELIAQHDQRLGTETGDAGEVDELGRVLLPQTIELLDRAGIDELADLGSRALADALHGYQLGLAEAGDVGRSGLETLDGVVVGPHPERLRAPLLQRHEGPQLFEGVEYLSLGGHNWIMAGRASDSAEQGPRFRRKASFRNAPTGSGASHGKRRSR